ncbi:MAG: polyisoprenoid-binding protein [Anaerolineaceae bacterium]|nr:polyisoprenoid-binding protein [Anaerolineaceae bacterium]
MAQWQLDPTHSSADFAARHMMISTVRGGFRNVTGTIDFDPENPEAASVEASIEVASMTSTGVADRDNHLKSPDFLDAEKYPMITFKSTRVEKTGDKTAKVYGDLTIRDVTRPAVIDAELLGIVNSPFGQKVAGFHGTTTINREDFGLTWNVAVEGGGVLVGKEIKIALDVEAVPVAEEVRA